MSDTSRTSHSVLVTAVAFLMLFISLFTPVKWWYQAFILGFAGTPAFLPTRWTSITAVGICVSQIALVRATVGHRIGETLQLVALGAAFAAFVFGILRMRRSRLV